MYLQPENLVGQVIDGHRLDSVLGHGGMGIVYRAENLALSRTVALKIINPLLAADHHVMRQFQMEAQALAKVYHPNIVMVHDFRQTESGVHLAMEYVDGVTLETYLRERGALPWRDAIPLIRQLLAALDYAHQVGVIHRDIKPRNIMIARNGIVKVTDFGLARMLRESGESTVTQATGGTVCYNSPEQIKGLSTIDQRSDLFSLGMMIYEMLTGRLPFDKHGTGYVIQKSIIEKPFPNPIRFKRDLPRTLTRIVMKALEKKPENRFQSAGEMLSVIEDFERRFEQNRMMVPAPTSLRALPPHAHVYPVAAAPPPPAPVYTQPAGQVFIVLFLVLFGLMGLGYYLLSNTPVPDEAQANTLADQGPLGAPDDPIFAPDDPIFAPDDPIFTPDDDETPSSGASSGGGASDETGSNETPPERTAPVPSSIRPTVSEAPYLAESTAPPPLLDEESAPVSAPVGNLSVQSEPSGAQLTLDGVPIGTTPSRLESLPIGPIEVVLNLAGYLPDTTRVDVMRQQTTVIYRRLIPRPALAEVRILAQPWGDIYVDGALAQEDSDSWHTLQLPARPHTVAIEHPEYGRWERRIDVSADSTLELVVDFTRTVPLRVTAFDTDGAFVRGEIFIDGQPTGEVTPMTIDVPIGLHRIEVVADGYALVNEANPRVFDENVNEPLEILLEKEDVQP